VDTALVVTWLSAVAAAAVAAVISIVTGWVERPKRMTKYWLRIVIVSLVVLAALISVMQVAPWSMNTTNGPPPDKGPSRSSPRAQPPTAKTTSTITVGNRPLGVAVTPDGLRAYISNYVSGTVSMIDTGNDAVTGTLTVSGNPAGVAVSPDGRRAYITNDNSNTLSVIDTGNNALIRTITVGDNPVSVAVTPDGHRAYITNNKSHTVSVIDTGNNTVIGTIIVGNNPVSEAYRKLSLKK
jgi:YVTN family beta-propeller protein